MTDETLQFLRALFGDLPSAAPWFHAWSCPPKGDDGPRRTFWCQSPADAAPAIADGTTGRNVYLGIALAARSGTTRERICQDADPARPGRIVAAGVVAVVAELDIVGPGHDTTGARYFPDRETALRFTTDLPLPPTHLIQSGHGLHCWWQFATPWLFTTDDDRRFARALSRDWSTVIQRRAAAIGYDVDAVHDLSRLMRLPGTVNVNGGDPQPVRILESHPDRRYTPGELVRCCLAEGIDPDPAPTRRCHATADPDPAADADRVGDVDADALRARLERELRRDRVLRASWERSRKLPWDGDTPSGYDLALCTRLALRGWTAPELGWLLRWSRRCHEDKTNPLRPSGLRCTVDKALASAARVRAERIAVPVDLIGKVRPGALRLFALLAAEGSDLGGQRAMASRLGTGERMARQYCRELIGTRVLTVRRGGNGRPGTYVVAATGETVAVSRAAVHDGRVSHPAFVVLAAVSHTVGPRLRAVYQAHVAEWTGLARATVNRELQALESFGYLESEDGGGWHWPNRYRVSRPAVSVTPDAAPDTSRPALSVTD